MQNSPCVLSKWKNKHTCQVQCHQKVLQCSVGGAELNSVMGQVVLKC